MVTLTGSITFVADTLPEYEIIKQRVLGPYADVVATVVYDDAAMSTKITIERVSDVNS